MSSIDIFPWDDNFNTGLAEVDAQHRRLVGLINRLASHVAFGEAGVALAAVFDELVAYAGYHFETEEAIWHRYLSEDSSEAAHLKAHQGFVEAVQRLKSRQGRSSSTDGTEDVLDFLVRWLAAHILESDRYMAETVLALQRGMSLEAAKAHAKERMSGATRAMIDIILSIYGTLSRNTLRLMRELVEHKRVDRQLQQSEASFRSLFDNVQEAVYVVAADGRFLAVNAGAERLYGHRRDWFVGKAPGDVSAPGRNDMEAVGAAHARALAGEPQSFEFWGVRADGGVFPKEVHLTRGAWYGQTVVIALAQDITERKRVEDRLRAQLDELRRWQAVMLEREDRVLDLKGEVNALLARLGEPPRYGSAGAAGGGSEPGGDP